MKKLFIILATLVLASCASSFSLVTASAVTVHGITLTPQTNWSKSNHNQHKKSAIWTKDGFTLNELIIAGGINDGDTLFASNNKELPLPTFRHDMLPNEVEEFVKTSIKNVHGGKVTVKTEQMEPQMVGDDMGFRLKLTFFLEDGLGKSVDSLLSVKNGSLYAVMYISPTVHYSTAYQGEIEKIFSTMTII